jgi:fructose-specific phosphotransferase system IIC component
MRNAKIGLWVLFILLQVLGVLIPRFTNIHSNIWPAFGLLLLVPGILLAAVFGLTWGVVLSVPVNAVAWYFSLRLLDEKEGLKQDHE